MSSILEIHSLCKTYKSSKKSSFTALDYVDLDILAGETLGLLGQNGAGKTTLCSIITGLHPPTSGSIKFLGKPIDRDLTSYRAHVGYCPQIPNFNNQLNVYDTIYFACLCYAMKPKEAASRTDELIDIFLLGNMKHKNPSQLSGGYKQRFLFARSIVHRPKILILDEPTVGLDTEFRFQVWDIIRSLQKEKMTIILTSHYLDEVEALCSRVCLLHEGKKKLIEEVSNLKKRYNDKHLEAIFLELMKEQKDVTKDV